MDNRKSIEIKLDALQRLIMNNTLSGILPLYIVTEYPKSGGSWLSQMLAEYLDVPFPRNTRPGFESSVMHGHMLYTPFMRNVVCLFRDGRDVMVSLYYHMLFENDKNSPIIIANTRRDLPFNDYEDIHGNLGEFIQYIHERQSSSVSPYKFTWGKFVKNWKDRNVVYVKYEDLISDCNTAVSKIISDLTGDNNIDVEKLNKIVNKYSFENQTKRKPGQENISSFIRNGKPGDWMEKFSVGSAKTFHRYYGEQMIQLGYINDKSWINELS